MNFQDTGGKTVGLNPFTGQVHTSLTNTQSPNSIASNAVTMRGQNMVDRRAAQEIAAGGKPPFLTSKNALDAQASELDRIMQDVGKVSGQARQPQNQPGKIVDWSDL